MKEKKTKDPIVTELMNQLADRSNRGIIKYKNTRKAYFRIRFEQEAYAKMYEERTGIKISQVVIVIAVINSDPQVFFAYPDENIERLKEVINNYDTV